MKADESPLSSNRSESREAYGVRDVVALAPKGPVAKAKVQVQ